MNNDEKTRLAIINSKHNRTLTDENKARLKELEIFKDKVPFQFKNGWVDLVYEIGKDITELCKLTNCELPVIERVKSKYATLRVDYYFNTKVPPIIERLIDSLLYEAEDKSSRICEVCGKEGQLRTTKSGSWDFTVCDEHKEDYLTMEEFKEYSKRHSQKEIISKLKDLKPLYKEKGLEIICIDDNRNEEDYKDLDIYYKIDMEVIKQYTKSVQKGKWVVTQLMDFFDEIKSHFRIEITFYAEKCLEANYKVIYIEE